VPLAVLAGIKAEGVAAGIKWPNDIWAGERKLCGMLIDAELSDIGAIAMPGIGVNVNGDPTLIPELREIATSLQRELGRPVQRERLLAGVCNELQRLLSLPQDEVIDLYRRGSVVLGKAVLVTPLKGDPYEATARRIAADGSLVVERADGRVEELNAAEVTLRPVVGASPG
jgi:BirA family biotin operon repressor/biotin-[acetyl-CoA-carboxylase] ligase